MIELSKFEFNIETQTYQIKATYNIYTSQKHSRRRDYEMTDAFIDESIIPKSVQIMNLGSENIVLSVVEKFNFNIDYSIILKTDLH